MPFLFPSSLVASRPSLSFEPSSFAFFSLCTFANHFASHLSYPLLFLLPPPSFIPRIFLTFLPGFSSLFCFFFPLFVILSFIPFHLLPYFHYLPFNTFLPFPVFPSISSFSFHFLFFLPFPVFLLFPVFPLIPCFSFNSLFYLPFPVFPSILCFFLPFPAFPSIPCFSFHSQFFLPFLVFPSISCFSSIP